jgi:hypothetical protein
MAQTDPAATFVLHRTRFGKGAMKFGINCTWRTELFLIVIFHFPIGKAALNAPRLWKECLSGISQGATVFVAAFPILNEI